MLRNRVLVVSKMTPTFRTAHTISRNSKWCMGVKHLEEKSEKYKVF